MDRVKVLILAGGLGTRIQQVNPDLPKVMLPVYGKPFLEYIIIHLGKQHFKQIVLCVGHKYRYIKNYFGSGEKFNVNIHYSVEPRPLGTGGALINALKYISTDNFMVMNGDSFIDVDLLSFLKFHYEHNSICSLVLHQSADTQRYGTVLVDDHNRITTFKEKSPKTADDCSYISAGAYCLKTDTLRPFAAEKILSIEKDIFPEIVKSKRMYGYVCNSHFIDIGIPSAYYGLLENQQILRSMTNGSVGKRH